MSEKRFPFPVRVTVQAGQEYVIGSAFDAVEFLRGWSGNKAGRTYRLALQHSLDAQDGIVGVSKAYDSFVIAARENGLLMPGADLRDAA